MIGVALHQIALWQTVVGTDQQVGLFVLRGIGTLNRLGQRFDIVGAVEIGGNGARRGLPFLFGQRGKESVIRRCGRGPGVLRIKREKQDLLAPCSGHCFDLGLGRWVAVAHGVIDHHIGTVTRLQRRLDLGGL